MSLLTTPRVFGQSRSDDLANWQKILGIVCRSIFMVALLVVAARVSAPQHIGSSWLDIPSGDFIRAIVGFGFCLWVLVHLFILPKDAAGYRTWTYLGAALIPLALICGIAVW
jgi:TRAP-type C4-dicarboxylate transport system permease small subunit